MPARHSQRAVFGTALLALALAVSACDGGDSPLARVARPMGEAL